MSSVMKRTMRKKTYSFQHLVLKMTRYLHLWMVLLLCLSDISSAAQPETKTTQTASVQTIRLTSLDWAPYTGVNLPDGGETTRLLRQVFEEIGYQLQVDFLPWNQAVNQVMSGVNGHLAYYPEYPVKDKKLLLSGAIGYSELGLVESKDRPLLLTSFLALANYRFGVVQDYLNMSELDRFIAAKTLQPKVNLSDKDNVLQVARGELDAAVIDKRVLHYLLKYDPEVIAAAAGRVQFSQSLREHKSLHLVFLANPKNRRLVEKFNQQLQRHKMKFLPSNAPQKKP